MTVNDAGAGWSIGGYARLAGAAYLAIIGYSLLSLILLAPHASTASDVAANDVWFRLALAGDALMYAGVVLLAWALYVLLKPVHAGLALLAMVWRLMEAALGGVTVLLGLLALALPASGSPVAAALIEARVSATVVVMVPLCLGTVTFCALFWKSHSIPRPLAGFGVVAFALMLVCALASIVAPELVRPAFLAVGAATILFEITIGAWLLVRGVNVVEVAA